jgi:hypothetical protein
VKEVIEMTLRVFSRRVFRLALVLGAVSLFSAGCVAAVGPGYDTSYGYGYESPVVVAPPVVFGGWGWHDHWRGGWHGGRHGAWRRGDHRHRG